MQRSLLFSVVWYLPIFLLGLPLISASAKPAAPLQTFTVKDYIQHAWTNEIVHFAIAYQSWRMPESLALTDAAGQPVPCQVSGLGRRGLTITGAVWTVVSVPPKGEVVLQLRKAATPSVSHSSPPSHLSLAAQGQDYVLRNEFMALRLPKLPGALAQPVELSALPAPLLALAGADGARWLGQGVWTNKGEPLWVTNATTTVVEQGPVRVTVRYRLAFADGRFYQAEIMLGDRQECALFTDDTDVEATNTAFRFSFQPGLDADRIYWRHTYWADRTQSGLTPGPLDSSKEQTLFKLRPWSFWWARDYAIAAGFYKDGKEPFVGVIAVRPSRWSPYGWDGFDRTPLPVIVRPGGGIDLTLALLAWPRQPPRTAPLTGGEEVAQALSQEALARTEIAVSHSLPSAEAGALTQRALSATRNAPVFPMHRELAITVGAVAQHVTNDYPKAKLRLQLVKHSHFPLDEVKDFGFDFQPAKPGRKHPFLLFTQADIERVRKQAQTIPAVKAEVDAALKRVTSDPYHNAAPAFMGSADKTNGVILADLVRKTARNNVAMPLEAPTWPDACFGHVYPGNWTRLLFAYDTLASTDYLTADEKQDIEMSLIFGAHVIAHPDYWNTARGLCSANPNMTALIKLPWGLMALFLEGHPRAEAWLRAAEDELRQELAAWIAPGGAWIESPGYQGASLDPMFPLMQALKNVKGRDYFADPRFIATMEYYTFLHTPPDRRFQLPNITNPPAPMVLATIGDTSAGTITPFTGWMALSTAKSDPAFSARQQFVWTSSLCSYNSMYTPGYTLALTDPELPAAAPTVLARGFPGFGSVLRTSWRDPLASYVAHRTGPNLHHMHDDYNEIVYHAKGAPLCLDFGNCYAPLRRHEPWYHNRVSFNIANDAAYQADNGNDYSTGQLVDFRSLPRSLDYSHGRSKSKEGAQDDRHVLLVKSADPLGANYVVLRDHTTDGAQSVTGGTQTNQSFYWNLFCLATNVETAGRVAHFAGRLGVDLDVHVLAPAAPAFAKQYWAWTNWLYPWNIFTEAQHGVRVGKTGSADDFLALLYPRVAGQGQAQITALADGRAVEVGHMEGKDVLLFSPGKQAVVTSGDVRLAGEIAFVRRYTNGDVRLAVVKGMNAAAAVGSWELQSSGPVAVTIKGTAVEVESSGDAHAAKLTLPPAISTAAVTLDGKPLKSRREGNRLTISLPHGSRDCVVGGK